MSHVIAYYVIHLPMGLSVLVSVHALLTLAAVSTLMVAWPYLERELIPQSTTALLWLLAIPLVVMC